MVAYIGVGFRSEVWAGGGDPGILSLKQSRGLQEAGGVACLGRVRRQGQGEGSLQRGLRWSS